MTAQPVYAATQGTNGLSSTGSVDITLTTGLSARIAGLADMLLGTWSGIGNMASNQNICIGRTGIGFFGSGTYRIRASGDGDPSDVNAFTLTDGADLLHYDVFFNDQPALAGRSQLTAGAMLSGQTTTGFPAIWNWFFGCVFRNANVSIDVPEAALQAAAGGTYTGTLTVVLIPD